ncbi:MAG: hypothetical protein ACXAD7_01265 [Candidatus Kariarchaeaceae archaeon]
MLIEIYRSPRRYSDLIELTNLKPGSLYHHLNVLKPLVEKRAHGLYHITKIGISLVEKLNLVNIDGQKPNIIETKTSPFISEPNIQRIETDVGSAMDQEASKIILHSTDTIDDALSLLWLGWSNYFLLISTLIITVILSSYGISLAGSAIYAIGGWIALSFDLIAFTLGWMALYTLERYSSNNRIYGELRFSLAIRLISMMPGAIVGIALLLLFLNGNSPKESAYPWLFVITLGFGLIACASGIHYLRGRSSSTALRMASIPITIDLLMGTVVLVA